MKHHDLLGKLFILFSPPTLRTFEPIVKATVRRVEPRRGRGIRYYRAVSDAFFAPFQASSAASLEELFTTSLKNHQDGVIGSVARAWTKLVSPSITWGVYAQGDADGLGTLAVVPDVRQGRSYDLLDWLADPESPAVWDNTYPLRLSHEDAKALRSRSLGRSTGARAA